MRSSVLVLLAIAALVACEGNKGDEPPAAPKFKKRPAPQTPLPPLAADPGGATGKPSWAMSFGGIGSTASRSVATDAHGNVYVCGYFEGTVDLGDGPKLGQRASTPTDPP